MVLDGLKKQGIYAKVVFTGISGHKSLTSSDNAQLISVVVQVEFTAPDFQLITRAHPDLGDFHAIDEGAVR